MNFDFLKPFADIKKLYEYCSEADEFALSKPNISATSARKAMEYIVKAIYISIAGRDDGLTVFEMISDERFVQFLNDSTLISTIHYIRKMGNIAVHDGNLSRDEALSVLEQLHFLVGEFTILLGLINDYPEFEKPTHSAQPVPPKAPEEKPELKPAPKAEKVVVEQEVIAKFAERLRYVTFNTAKKRDEAENRKLFLNACLREAGWPIVNRENQSLPASAGINMLLDDGDTVDYVLYGRDNRPLAVIDYKTTSQDLIAGRMKAIAAANKLSAKYGYKPIVYYTNGYFIYVIDQLGYKPRRVFQFHSIEELELFKLRASIRLDISQPQINDAITNRDYQKNAITATCKAFMDKRRHSLLVMATGTGKTRISISLVDILMKANWVKNVLFLADRTSLVRQAHKNFNKLLPSVTTSIYTGDSEDRDANARIIFSTYQTMINLINDDTREFGIGRFDLIVIDEAHRSIFAKYSALFHYFDALMVGLTATPRADNNKSTYTMFEMKEGEPDYAYELEQAINEGYLVGFSVLDKTTDKMRRGIHYDELSEEEKQSLEDAFATGDSTEPKPDMKGLVLKAAKMDTGHMINLGTIDAMLNDLMKNGLKVDGGDKIGKTIIFAKNHVEAELIAQRFQKLYPYLGLDFCKLIDSQVPGNQQLIEAFGERGSMPQVVVSVDMMDTGIDVPDVLNLVFFKVVKSKIKFLQMVGRGTRLSPDVYGPGMDKKGFFIFDYYDNFGFFRTSGTWSTIDSSSNGKVYKVTPQSELINRWKLLILDNLNRSGFLMEFDKKYQAELKDYFVSTTRGLCNDDVEVQYHMPYVSKYRTAEMWDEITKEKLLEIAQYILPLFPPEPDPVKVKNFDLLIYAIEQAVPVRQAAGKDIRKIKLGFGNVGNKITMMMDELLKLKTIPEVMKKKALIESMRGASLLFEKFSLENCEAVRKELRNFMTYLQDDVRYYIFEAKDFVIDGSNDSAFEQEKSYAEKAREYLEKLPPAVAKLRNLDELTQEEKDELDSVFKTKLGSETDFASWSGGKPMLPFLRKQVGIADEALSTKFGSFMNEQTLDAQQLVYVNQIISYARENGDITFMDLQKVSPFCDTDIMALFGQKIMHIKTLITGLHKPVM